MWTNERMADTHARITRRAELEARIARRETHDERAVQAKLVYFPRENVIPFPARRPSGDPPDWAA